MTNKESEPMPRKRAPGGGRKPAGPISGKLSNFSTRITNETRQALEAMAKELGQSISQVAERLIKAGLAEKRAGNREPAMRALCFLIAQLADHIVGPKAVIPGKRDFAFYDWRSDPFFYRAFKIAVGQLLDALEPPGPIKAYEITTKNEADLDPSMKRYLETFKTPEARAQSSVDYLLTAFRAFPRWSVETREEQRKLVSKYRSPQLLREIYGMPDAARDLAVEASSGETVVIEVRVKENLILQKSEGPKQ
jgi:hypothetical protein